MFVFDSYIYLKYLNQTYFEHVINDNMNRYNNAKSQIITAIILNRFRGPPRYM